MRLVLTNLLRYFDDPRSEERGKGDATALMQLFGEDLGAALFMRYLNQKWGHTVILPGSCTTGHQRGPRLDRWIKTTRDGNNLLIQLEIKSWSAHAIGGKNLSLNASAEELRWRRKENWKKEWNGTSFKKKQAAKVLESMRSPEENLKVEPAICYWDAMHPEGSDEPLFKIDLGPDGNFKHVWVFSVSNYLRKLIPGTEELELELPNVKRRLGLISSLVLSTS